MTSYKIYPQRNTKSGDFTTMPVIVFLIGSHTTKFSYQTLLESLTNHHNIIVYVLDTNPDSEWKTLDAFLPLIPQIPKHIQDYYDITHTSNQYYLGGHQIGATIAINSIYPENRHSSLHSLTMHSLNLPLAGLICLHPIDGTNNFCLDYENKPKYDGRKQTCYVTSHGHVNPFPILLFTTACEEVEERGENIFEAIANGHNHPKNKYCFISEKKYHAKDLIDENATSHHHSLPESTFRVHQRDEEEQEKIKQLYAFVIEKIVSFLFDDELDTSGMDDIHLSRKTLH